MSQQGFNALKAFYGRGYSDAMNEFFPITASLTPHMQRAYESGYRDGRIRKQELDNLSRATQCLAKAAEGTALEVIILEEKS